MKHSFLTCMMVLSSLTAFSASAQMLRKMSGDEPSGTPRPYSMPAQNWSHPNPAPELWNADQVVDCSETVFEGLVKSSHFTTPSNQFDAKTGRLILVPHREEEVDYEIEVTKSLRGKAVAGQTVHIIAYPYNEDDSAATKIAIRQRSGYGEDYHEYTPPISDLNYRVKFEVGKKYLIFDSPSPYSGEEITGDSDPWLKRVRAATATPEKYNQCQKIQNEVNHPEPVVKFDFAGMQCTKHDQQMMSPDKSQHFDCELTCEKDGKIIFRKDDYCAEKLVVSPDQHYLLGLANGPDVTYSAWAIDKSGSTYFEMLRSYLHMSTSIDPMTYRDTVFGHSPEGIKGGQPAAQAKSGDVPAPKLRARYLERFGPGTETQASWYDRLNPGIRFVEKNNVLSDLEIRTYDHQLIKISALTSVEALDEKALTQKHWDRPSQRIQRLNSDLLTAVEHGDLNAAKAAVDGGANPTAHKTLFWTALDQGNTAMVSFLMDHGVKSDERSKKGVSPLNFASFLGNTELMAKLIAAGANVNKSDELAWGWTPLMRATMMNHADAVKLLLKAGADRSARDQDHKTALDYAKEKHLTEIEKLLTN